MTLTVGQRSELLGLSYKGFEKRTIKHESRKFYCFFMVWKHVYKKNSRPRQIGAVSKATASYAIWWSQFPTLA